VGAVVHLQPRWLPVWLALLLGVLSLHLVYVGAAKTWSYSRHSPAREAAQVLRGELPAGETVFELTRSPRPFPVLAFYLQRPVRKVGDAADLPLARQVVYVLGRDEVPVARDATGAEVALYAREWRSISPVVSYEGYNLRMWRGRRSRRQ